MRGFNMEFEADNPAEEFFVQYASQLMCSDGDIYRGYIVPLGGILAKWKAHRLMKKEDVIQEMVQRVVEPNLLKTKRIFVQTYGFFVERVSDEAKWEIAKELFNTYKEELARMIHEQIPKKRVSKRKKKPSSR